MTKFEFAVILKGAALGPGHEAISLHNTKGQAEQYVRFVSNAAGISATRYEVVPVQGVQVELVLMDPTVKAVRSA